MSLREDLKMISKKEGFENTQAFIHNFIVEENQTFKQLTQYLKDIYRRYYSWNWVFIYCSKFISGYKISKRVRAIDGSGFRCQRAQERWQEYAINLGYPNLDMMFRSSKRSLASLARLMGVNYMSLYIRHQKWKEANNVK